MSKRLAGFRLHQSDSTDMGWSDARHRSKNQPAVTLADFIAWLSGLLHAATPLGLSIVLSLVAVAAALISQSTALISIPDPVQRQSAAVGLLKASLPPNLCLAAFSFDIWALTTITTGDKNALMTYNLAGKSEAVVLLISVHILIYVLVLAWGGVVRLPTATPPHGSLKVEAWLSVFAVIGCIIMQAYP